MRTSQKQRDSDWHDGFLFLGNQLALDFVNTRPVIKEEPVELLPDFPALLRWFQAADLLTPREVAKLRKSWERSSRADRVLRLLRKLREELREAVAVWERGEPVPQEVVEELNRLMTAHPLLDRLTANGANCSLELWFVHRAPEDLVAPLAHSAAKLFAEADRERVHRCEGCVLHFHDTSKKGTRRWCSMRLCGNRSKVAAYVARQRRETKVLRNRRGA